MQNVELSRDGKHLIVKVDLEKDFGLSNSGKTTIVASTQGNVDVPGAEGEIKIGVNVYKKKKS
jgi:hypothetical protein